MVYIKPTKEQFKAFKNYRHDGPIAMVNLLKFNANSGVESFSKYEEFTIRFIKEKLGGKVIYKGKYIMPLIGEGDWDSVLIVEYPSIASFLKMQMDEEYLKMLPYRINALAESRVYFTIADV